MYVRHLSFRQKRQQTRKTVNEAHTAIQEQCYFFQLWKAQKHSARKSSFIHGLSPTATVLTFFSNSYIINATKYNKINVGTPSFAAFIIG